MVHSKVSGKKFIYGKLLLIICWLAGLLIGFIYAKGHCTELYFLMRIAVAQRVSIVGIVFSLSFPLIISAIAIHLDSPLVLSILAFLKAFCFGCCCCAVVAAFGSSGWFIRWLLLFSDSCIVVVLLWLWLKSFAGDEHTIHADVLISIVIAIIIGCVDYFVVSPFMVSLFQ